MNNSAGTRAEGEEQMVDAQMVHEPMAEELDEDGLDQDPMDIHTYFGLSYANYLVRPRALLQSMPEGWQQQFVALLRQMDGHFADVGLPDYRVETGRWAYVYELDDATRGRLGITDGADEAIAALSEDDPEHDARVEAALEESVFYDADGNELDRQCGQVFVPGPNPIPPYDRGRTFVRPDGSVAMGPVSVP